MTRLPDKTPGERMRRISRQLSFWYQGKTGRVLADEARLLVRQWLAGSFGYYAVELSVCNHERSWLEGGKVRSCFCLGVEHGDVLADFDNLPIDSESLDLVLAYHVLEFSAAPYQFLREVERVLIPEGKFILVSFNPFGLQGLRNMLIPSDEAPWCAKCYPTYRIRDWLGVLGFDVQKVCYLSAPFASLRPSAQFFRTFNKYVPWVSSLTAVYTCKRVSSMKPVGVAWRPSLLRNRAMQPTTFRR